MLDTRISEWKYLISLKELKNILMLGIPSIQLLKGLSTLKSKIYIIFSSEDFINTEFEYMKKEIELKIELVQLKKNDTFPFLDESIDLIIITNSFEIDKTLSECERVLVPGGHIVIFAQNKNCGVNITKFINRDKDTQSNFNLIQEDLVKKNLSGYKNIKTYALLPSLKDVRWIIPIQSVKLITNSLTLYQPSLISAKLKKKLSIILSKAGLTKLWTPFRVIIAEKNCSNIENKQNLTDLLKDIFDRKDIEIALFTGTRGYYRKTTAQVMTGKGDIIAYAKIADNSHTGMLVENEAHTLNKIKSLDLVNGIVPEVIYFNNTGEKTLLVQSTIKPPFSYSPYNISDSHVEFLAELFNKTAKRIKFKESVCFKKLKKRIEDIEKRISNDWSAILQKSIDILNDNLGEKEISVALCHIDFTPWNILIDNKKIFVTDWESAEPESMPFYDMLHFEIQKHLVLKNTKILSKPFLNRDRRFNNLLRKYSLLTNSDTNLLNYCILFYLCDNIAFYLDITEKYWGYNEIEKDITFEIKKKLLDNTINQIISRYPY